MIGNLLRAALFLFLLAAAAGIGATANAQTLALVGGKVYASPDAAPLDDAVVVTANGVITAIGSRSDVQFRPMRASIDCTGKTSSPASGTATSISRKPYGRTPAPRRPLRSRAYAGDADAMGFHHRMGPRLRPQRTLPLRRRVNAGEILGPNILLVGSIFPRAAVPPISPEMRLPEAATPERAAQMARDYLRIGLDGMKLFTGAYKGKTSRS